MKEENLKRKLENLEKVDIDAPRFKQALKHSLMKRHESKKGVFMFVENSLNMIKTIKIVALPVAAFVLVLAFVFMVPQSGITNEVHAAELVQKAHSRTLDLPDEVRRAIESRIQHNLIDVLAEAKQAPDLRLLTEEEFQAEMEQKRSITSADGVNSPNGSFDMITVGQVAFEDGTTMDPEGLVHSGFIQVSSGTLPSMEIGEVLLGLPVTLKEPIQYLLYTDVKGRSVALGVDEDDTPVMLIVNMLHTEGGTLKMMQEALIQ